MPSEVTTAKLFMIGSTYYAIAGTAFPILFSYYSAPRARKSYWIDPIHRLARFSFECHAWHGFLVTLYGTVPKAWAAVAVPGSWSRLIIIA
jgi:hypothetical protein